MSEFDLVRTQIAYVMGRAQRFLPRRDERGINTTEVMLLLTVVVVVVGVVSAIIISYINSQKLKLTP